MEGVNFAVAIYLLLSTAGILALLAGFPAAFLPRRVFAWITVCSAAAVALVAAMFDCGFIWGRDRSVPFNSAIDIAGVHAPLVDFFGVAIVLCLVEAALYWPKAKAADSN